jgi:RNA 2'-O ribose methyltransferase substrate binding
MPTQTRFVAHASTKKLLRIGGLPAVSALFAVSPARVEQLFFDYRMRSQVEDLCAALARMRKPYRQVGADELERVAGTMLHGGVVALAQPRAVLPLDLGTAKAWATAVCCCCSMESETRTISAPLPALLPSSACLESSYPTTPRRQSRQTRAIASPKVAWNTWSCTAACALLK